MKSNKLSKRAIAKKHIHNRIIVQLCIFAAVILGFGGFITYDMLQEHMNILWVIASLVVGLLVGLAVGRIFSLKWHEDTQKVILSMDKLSILLIAAYVVFRVVSEQLLGHYLHGQELTIITFTVLVGIMIGRVVGMIRSIAKILKAQNIL